MLCSPCSASSDAGNESGAAASAAAAAAASSSSSSGRGTHLQARHSSTSDARDTSCRMHHDLESCAALCHWLAGICNLSWSGCLSWQGHTSEVSPARLNGAAVLAACTTRVPTALLIVPATAAMPTWQATTRSCAHRCSLVFLPQVLYLLA